MSKARTLSNFISSGGPLADGTISVSEISGAAPSDSPSFTGNITVSGTVDGRDIAADGTKLDGIEAGATADQTASEIKTAYESNANTNAFTDAEQSKLAGIEAGATADQTKADIDALGIAASTAATLATARNIALTGDVTGSANFDGSANISITAVVQDDSHNHVISNVDGLQPALDGKLNLSGGTITGTLTATNIIATSNGTGTAYRVGDDAYIGDINVANTMNVRGAQNSDRGYISFGNNSTQLGRIGTGYLTWGGSTIWHAGNDGSGSGLDADLLDGQQGSYYYSPANPPPASTPNTGLGQVGTYSILVAANSGVNVGVGGTIAGSSLRYMNNFPFDGDTFVPEASGGGGATMSGTWRNMSVDRVQYTSSGYYGIGLFVRVS